MILKIQKIYPDVKLPSYAHPGDAGLDLYAYGDFVIKAGERATILTGIKLELPVGYVCLAWDKSGLAFKQGIKSLGGVIDSGYRGEVKVCLHNLGTEDFEIKNGEKIIQVLIQKVEQAEVLECETLSDSDGRGEGGFGSTGRV